MRKVFEVMIHEKMYPVYDIDGKEHGGYNDTPKTWWLYHSEPLPDGTFPPLDSPYLVPYSSHISRHVWEFKIKQHSTTKEKWGDTQFNRHTSIEMWCNGKLFYEFGTSGGDNGITFAFAKIQYLITVLSEHPFNFFEPQKEQGRKICWYGMPATVVLSSYRPWEIRIKPDYTEIAKEEWWKEYKMRRSNHTKNDDDNWPHDDDESDDMKNDLINWGDAFSDEHIYWFRK